MRAMRGGGGAQLGSRSFKVDLGVSENSGYLTLGSLQ